MSFISFPQNSSTAFNQGAPVRLWGPIELVDGGVVSYTVPDATAVVLTQIQGLYAPQAIGSSADITLTLNDVLLSIEGFSGSNGQIYEALVASMLLEPGDVLQLAVVFGDAGFFTTIGWATAYGIGLI